MDANIERESSALGCLFQQIITDMKNGTPLWEDFISKATKLHTCLKTAVIAISAYLEAFQKIADGATSARGATKDIGTALTRICLRHKAVETRVKNLTSVFMDCLILPLQEKLEDWKKSLVYLDKEHTKEYKKARSELKKKSSDTLRLQKKKTRKGLTQQQFYSTLPYSISQGDTCNFTENDELGKLLESSVATVREKRVILEETERKAVRAALIEERGRFCQFAKFLKPVLDEEVAMVMELTHLQEVAEQLQKHAALPNHLPPASEQVILDVKNRDNTQWVLSTPPASPSLSLGSRKSSVCSISSLTSSSSGSCKSHPSPSSHSSYSFHKTSQQPYNAMVTLHYRCSVSSGSRDSGFTSLQENLHIKPLTKSKVNCTLSLKESVQKSLATSTWPDLQQDNVNLDIKSQNQNATNERPHTISSAYEKGHQRPTLSIYTFQNPEQTRSVKDAADSSLDTREQKTVSQVQQNKVKVATLQREKPPIPNRCSSLERPIVPNRGDGEFINSRAEHSKIKEKSLIPARITKELGSQNVLQQPTYVNMHEIASLAAMKAQELIPSSLSPVTQDSVFNASKIEYRNTGSQAKEISGETVIEHLVTPSSILNRRTSLQQTKAKTVASFRRVSTTSVGSDCASGNSSEDFENLPPPPAFLLEGGSQPSSTHSSPASQRRSVSVSETVRTLTELKHMPASPSVLRRKPNSQLPVAQNINQTLIQKHTAGHQTSPERKNELLNSGPGGVTQTFIAALSARFSNTVTAGSGSGSEGASSSDNSPKPLRKSFQDHQYHHNHHCSQNQNLNKNVNSKNSIGFLETLNAKLKYQHHGSPQTKCCTEQHFSNKSVNVRRLMANRVPIIDPLQVRDSLMDQIRKGTSLRKTSGPINDRSAPKIY